MIQYDSPIEQISFIQRRIVPVLKRLGIHTIKDLLYYFPSRYEDFSNKKAIREVIAGEVATIEGVIRRITVRRTMKKWMQLTEVVLEDETGKIKVVWYQQPYVARTLKIGDQLRCSGKVQETAYGIYLQSPAYERIKILNRDSESSQGIHTNGFVAVYPETAGITSRWLRFLVRVAIDRTSEFHELLPEETRIRYQFPHIRQALEDIHFPSSLEAATQARKRFMFEELLLLQLRALRERTRLKQYPAPVVRTDIELIKTFVGSLPFELTNAQRRSIWEIAQDIAKPVPMNRLLEGDVGSGKTIVAAAAALLVAKSGFRTIIMAPTEILAFQHFETLQARLSPFQLRIGLRTGSKKHTEDAHVIVGTHALIQKHAQFEQLGLVIIDEQHRFGVEQRAALLRNNQKNGDRTPTIQIPHFLSMTATPIPRTLALTIYGNLDISLLDEMPKSRKKIITRIIMPQRKEEIYQFIREEISRGRQAFVICPRIEEAETATPLGQQQLLQAELKAVTKEYEHLKNNVFPEFRIAMLHGRMPAKSTSRSRGKPSKEQVMTDFKNHTYDILVATSVIEVGVDIPNATVMVIEGAERFGLAQLHQFRGRIGRGEHQSHCFLFPTDDGLVTKRLHALVESHNGFELAEEDFKLRGPGMLFGSRQWGVPDLAFKGMMDPWLVRRVREEAITLIKMSPDLGAFPTLQQHLMRMATMAHAE